jgi:hypothetical protein
MMQEACQSAEYYKWLSQFELGSVGIGPGEDIPAWPEDITTNGSSRPAG